MREDITPKDVLIALRSCTGLLKIVVSFSGEGDSGGITDVELYAIGKHELPGEWELPAELRALYDAEHPATVQAFIETWVRDYIFQKVVDYDWYNNDGGGGTLTIEPYTGVISVEGYTNYIQQESQSCDASITDDPDFADPAEMEKING